MDMVKHGRSTRGEKDTRSKLKEGEVLLIKRILKAKIVPHSYIAKMFKVSRRTISSINEKTNWYWLKEVA